MVLRVATSLGGALEGVGPENRDFFGPWNGTSEASAITGSVLLGLLRVGIVLCLIWQGPGGASRNLYVWTRLAPKEHMAFGHIRYAALN
jgi:hypothetical protein